MDSYTDMSKCYKLSVLLCAMVSFFYACDPCASLDCSTGKTNIQFSFVSTVTGKNLVFGPNKMYDTSQIKFYALKGRDTNYFNFYSYLNANNSNDTALQIDFYSKIDTAYVRLNSTDTDTLTFSFKSYDTKCCGNLTDIITVRYNTMQAVTNQGVLEIRK